MQRARFLHKVVANTTARALGPALTRNSSTVSAINTVAMDQAPFLAKSPQEALGNKEIADKVKGSPTKKLNLCQAVNDAIRLAMETDDSAITFGEDVVFGGVFRCTKDLQQQFGPERVFNSPLSEQAVVGFGAGYASMGKTAIAEIQFADYIYPATNDIVNEIPSMRYRSGKEGFTMGGLTIRAPCGSVGHGGLYHSQSNESFFGQVPGLRVVMPRSPLQTKGLLLASIRSQDPVYFMEPKILYRTSVEEVPLVDYELPLDKAEVIKEGTDITLVGYGTQLYVMSKAAKLAEQKGISCEIIDLRTLAPWDRETVVNSVKKTGRCLVAHEAPRTGGIGSEVAAEVQRLAFLSLEAPVARVTGWDTPNPLTLEPFRIPDVVRILDGILNTVHY